MSSYTRQQVKVSTGLNDVALDSYTDLLDHADSAGSGADVEVNSDGTYTPAGLGILQAQAAHDARELDREATP